MKRYKKFQIHSIAVIPVSSMCTAYMQLQCYCSYSFGLHYVKCNAVIAGI